VSLEANSSAKSHMNAHVQARSHGHAGLTERLEGRLRVMELQQRTAEALAEKAEAIGGQNGNNGHSEAGEAAAELREGPKELADLYNDYAAHFQVRCANSAHGHCIVVCLMMAVCNAGLRQKENQNVSELLLWQASVRKAMPAASTQCAILNLVWRHPARHTTTASVSITKPSAPAAAVGAVPGDGGRGGLLGPVLCAAAVGCAP